MTTAWSVVPPAMTNAPLITMSTVLLSAATPWTLVLCESTHLKLARLVETKGDDELQLGDLPCRQHLANDCHLAAQLTHRVVSGLGARVPWRHDAHQHGRDVRCVRWRAAA
eukprot:1158115-Pleurochrysis_carterae.AAC.1